VDACARGVLVDADRELRADERVLERAALLGAEASVNTDVQLTVEVERRALAGAVRLHVVRGDLDARAAVPEVAPQAGERFVVSLEVVVEAPEVGASKVA